MQGGAHGQSSVGIDGAVAFVDQLDDALFVDDDVGAQSPLVGFVLNVVTFQDAVGSEHFAVHVAEKGESNADLLAEGGVGSGTIQTNAEDFRIRGVDFTGGDSSLDRLKLLRSTTGEGQDVDSQEDVLLAMEVAELDAFPAVAEKSEIRGSVTDLERHLGDLWFFALGGGWNNREGGCSQEPESDHTCH